MHTVTIYYEMYENNEKYYNELVNKCDNMLNAILHKNLSFTNEMVSRNYHAIDDMNTFIDSIMDIKSDKFILQNIRDVYNSHNIVS